MSFLDYKTKPCVFKQENKIISLRYTTRLNDKYETIKEKPQKLERGKTFKDSIANLFDPNVNKDKEPQMFGYAPKLEPLTMTMNRMKETIDNAIAKKSQLENEILQAQKDLEQIKNQEMEVTNNDIK